MQKKAQLLRKDVIVSIGVGVNAGRVRQIVSKKQLKLIDKENHIG